MISPTMRLETRDNCLHASATITTAEELQEFIERLNIAWQGTHPLAVTLNCQRWRDVNATRNNGGHIVPRVIVDGYDVAQKIRAHRIHNGRDYDMTEIFERVAATPVGGALGFGGPCPTHCAEFERVE